MYSYSGRSKDQHRERKRISQTERENRSNNIPALFPENPLPRETLSSRRDEPSVMRLHSCWWMPMMRGHRDCSAYHWPDYLNTKHNHTLHPLFTAPHQRHPTSQRMCNKQLHCAEVKGYYFAIYYDQTPRFSSSGIMRTFSSSRSLGNVERSYTYSQLCLAM